MVVDFAFRRAPAMRALSVAWKGPWKESRIRAEFAGLERYAKERKLRPRQWIFLEGGARSWAVALAVRGRIRADGRVRVRSFPATRVASVRFDPEAIAPRVVYHGLADWLRWRKKEGEIARVGSYREIYTANPWTSASAWKNCEIQVAVR